MRVTFVDVGQGDSILIQLGKLDVLVDTGPPGNWEHLQEVLSATSAAIDLVFITHPHNDHYGQLADILQRFVVSRVVTNGETPPTREGEMTTDWQRLEDSLQTHRLVAENLAVGDTLEPGPGLVLRVLATGSPTGGEFPDKASGQAINNDSLVLRLEYAGRSVLLTGDIGQLADDMLVQRYCTEGPSACSALKADVLKVPHHGSADFTPRLYEAVRPGWAVVSADYENGKHCLPRIEPLEALEKRNVAIYSTSAQGLEDVTLEISAAGEIRWRVPSKPIFAWRKVSRVCSPEIRAQGFGGTDVQNIGR